MTLYKREKENQTLLLNNQRFDGETNDSRQIKERNPNLILRGTLDNPVNPISLEEVFRLPFPPPSPKTGIWIGIYKIVSYICYWTFFKSRQRARGVKWTPERRLRSAVLIYLQFLE